MSESDVQELALIHVFHYPETSQHRKSEILQMSRLNYFASRIRAAICAWARTEIEVDSAIQVWWWNGLHDELVTYKIFFEKIGSLIESRMPQWPMLVTPWPV